MDFGLPKCFCCRYMGEGVDEEIMTAVQDGNMYNTKGLIEFYGMNVSPAWSDGYVLLCEALKHARKNVAEYLLLKGCNIKIDKPTPDSPLELAVQAGFTSIVQKLIDKGVSVNAQVGKRASTPLCTSVFMSNMDITKLLLSAGADVNMQNSDGGNPLLIAAGKCNAAFIRFLIEQGAQVNSVYVKPSSREGFTLLHAAAQNRKYGVEVAEYLLGVGVNIDAKSADLRTPLHAAVERGNEKLVKVLLQRGADVYTQDKNGRTVLTLALKKNHAGIIDLVLSYSRNIDSNPTAFCHAVINCGEEIINKMLQCGFTMSPQDVHDHKFMIGAVSKGLLKVVEEIFKVSENLLLLRGSKVGDMDWRMPLNIASQFKQEAIAKLLISLGADVNANDSMNVTPIVYAVENLDVNMFELLLSHGADVKSYQGLIHTPCKKGCLKIVEALLEHGADVNSQSRGTSALVVALVNRPKNSDSCKTVEIAELCVRKGANVNCRGNFGETPLIVASQKELESVVKLLLDHHADVNCVDKEGRTALHCTVQCRNLKLSKMLLTHSARVNAKNKDGLTPLHIACKSGPKELVELLLEWGADVNSQCVRGTGLHIACADGEEKIVDVLLKYDADVTNLCRRDTPFQCASSSMTSSYSSISGFGRSNRRTRNSVRAEKFRQCHATLATHLIKMISADLHVHVKDVQELRLFACKRSGTGNEGRPFPPWTLYAKMEIPSFSRCTKEVEIMKEEKIDGSIFTFYDLLIGNTNSDFELSRYESLVQSLKSDCYQKKFPMYSNMMINNLENRKKVVESRAKCTGILLYWFPGMPDLCTEQILGYLKNHDLRILNRAFCTDIVSSI